ncbi:MAG: DUF6714 family protein [Planctomycetota bacterium]
MTNDPFLERHMQNKARLLKEVPLLQRVRDDLVADIRRAFLGVWRENGVSLREAYEIDNYGTEKDRLAARAKETDTAWDQVDVVAIDPGGACLTYVDQPSFRYYLPAYMVQALLTGYGPLGNAPDEGENALAFLPYKLSTQFSSNPDQCKQRWSDFDSDQLSCTARYLAFDVMFEYDDINDRESIDALREGWIEHLPDADRKRVESFWPGVFD